MNVELRANDAIPRNFVMLAAPGLVALTNVYVRGNEIMVEGVVDTRKVAVCRIDPEPDAREEDE